MAIKQHGELGAFAIAFAHEHRAFAILRVTDALAFLEAGGATGRFGRFSFWFRFAVGLSFNPGRPSIDRTRQCSGLAEARFATEESRDVVDRVRRRLRR